MPHPCFTSNRAIVKRATTLDFPLLAYPPFRKTTGWRLGGFSRALPINAAPLVILCPIFCKKTLQKGGNDEAIASGDYVDCGGPHCVLHLSPALFIAALLIAREPSIFNLNPGVMRILMERKHRPPCLAYSYPESRTQGETHTYLCPGSVGILLGLEGGSRQHLMYLDRISLH